MRFDAKCIQIRSKRTRCIFFGIIRMQDTDFMNKLSLNHITENLENRKQFFIKKSMSYEKIHPEMSQNSEIYWMLY
jgi:hypothetical protein